MNRFSFLRGNNSFLSASFNHPSTLFLLLSNLAPLAESPTKLAFASLKDVQSLIEDDPYRISEEEAISAYNSTAWVPQLIFLGLDERQQNDDVLKWTSYSGVPYFALDVTPKGSIEAQATNLRQEFEADGKIFLEGRSHMSLPAHEAAMYSQARALIDWNARNPFCASCGHPTLSIQGGTKRSCPPTDMASSSSSISSIIVSTTEARRPMDRPACSTRKGIINLSFPRTDPTVIMAILSADSRRVLVGRKKQWPENVYSNLAGFVEPAESIEEAVRREAWEESGVVIGRVVIHSSQPWPYPANLMIGAIAQTIPGGEEVMLKHDPELEDAKWVDLDEIRVALAEKTGGGGGGRMIVDKLTEELNPKSRLKLPPKTTIANQLLTAVVTGFLGNTLKI